MNRISKSSLSIICFLSLLIGITSCSPDIPDISATSVEKASEISASKTAKKELKADISGSHILMAFDNNFTVDAAYSGPDNDEADRFVCKIKEIDDETLIRVLFDGDQTEKKFTSTGLSYISGNRRIDFIHSASGSRISFQRNKYDRYGNVFRGEFGSDFNGSGPLEFMSPSEAVDLVKKTLDSLGIDYAVNADIKSYNTAVLESLGNDGKALRGDNDNNEDPYADYIYTKEDELYHITMYPAVDNIPISIYLSDTDLGIFASVSANGIEKLEICTSFEKKEGSERGSGKIVPVETALQKLHDYYSEHKKDKKIKVTDVSFKYQAKDNGDEGGFDLTPVWEIISTFNSETDELMTNFSDIDAYTGEFLPDGVDSSLFIYR